MGASNEIKTSLRLKSVYPLTHSNEFVIDKQFLFEMDSHSQIKKYKGKQTSVESTGLMTNCDRRACLRYGLRVIGNANLLLNESEWQKEEMHSPYGYLLQFRLEKFVLMCENNQSRFQLMKNTKTSTVKCKKYKFIAIALAKQSDGKKQRHHNKILDDLSWQDLKWSDRGLKIGEKLYKIDKVWMVN